MWSPFGQTAGIVGWPRLSSGLSIRFGAIHQVDLPLPYHELLILENRILFAPNMGPSRPGSCAVV